MQGGVGVWHPGAVLEPDRRAVGVDDAVDLLLHLGLKRNEMNVQGSAKRGAQGCVNAACKARQQEQNSPRIAMLMYLHFRILDHVEEGKEHERRGRLDAGPEEI